MADLSNLTYSVGDYNFTTATSSPFTIIGSVTVVWVVVVNSLVLVSLLSSAALRGHVRIQLIVCLGFVDLTTGILSTGVFTYISFTQYWTLGCPFHTFVQLLGVYADIFLASWYLVLYNASFFLDLMHVELPKLTPLGTIITRVILLLSPLILFCVVCLPIVFTQPAVVFTNSKEFCPLYLTNAYEIVMSFICFFLPATSTIVLCVLFVGFRKDRTVSRQTLARDLLGDEPTLMEKPLYFLAPSLAVVMMGMPEQMGMVLFFSNIAHPDKTMYTVFATLEVMRQGVLPLTWLVFPDIRQAVQDRLSCKKCKTSTAMVATNISYKNLQNE